MVLGINLSFIYNKKRLYKRIKSRFSFLHVGIKNIYHMDHFIHNKDYGFDTKAVTSAARSCISGPSYSGVGGWQKLLQRCLTVHMPKESPITVM